MYSIDIGQLDSSWRIVDDTSHGNKTNFESYLTVYPLSVPKSDIKADILTAEDVAFLCSQENGISAEASLSNETTALEYKKLKEKIKLLDEFKVSANYENISVDNCIPKENLDDRPLRDCYEKDCSMETEPKHTEVKISQIPISGDADLDLSNDELNKDRTEPESKEMEPPEGDSENYKELLDYYATYFLRFLEISTMRRVFNLPREGVVNCKLNSNNFCAKDSYMDHQVCHSSPSCVKPKHAKVGILFSGGIDSMVLAAVADRYDIQCRLYTSFILAPIL